ncbi:glycosyltransferase family 39 protein [Candidatus Fermentibacteria bacterium]|nr:glycosyltransferase family 39 protein [Candidatus Fermentibacteria bacterium]
MLSRTRPFLFDALIVASLMAIHGGYISFPPEDPDVGGITYNAMLINRGLVPYRDSFEQKLPGAFFLAAGWTRLLGESTFGLNLAALLWSAVHLIVLLWGVRRLWGSGPSRWAGIAFVIASTAPVLSGRCPNYELWMTTPITWGILLLMTATKGGLLRLGCAGFLVASGALVKQQAAFSCLPLILWAVIWKKNTRRGMKEMVAVAAGAALAAVPIVAFFLAKGELSTFLRMIDPRGAAAYAAGGGAAAGVVWRIARQETMRVVREMPLLYYAGTAVLATLPWSWVQREPRDDRLSLLASWILGAALGVAAGMRFYTHYYVQLIPPLCLSVGWVASQLRPSWRASSRHTAAAFLLVATLAWPSLGRVAHDARMAWWQAKFALLGRDMPAIAPLRLAEVIRQCTQPDTPILVWGHAEDLYFLTGRLAPTRYYKYYAFLSPPPTTWGVPTMNPQAADHSARFLHELTKEPPSAIVVSSLVGSAPPDIFPEFQAFLMTGYRHEAAFDGLDLWLPRPASYEDPAVLIQ